MKKKYFLSTKKITQSFGIIVLAFLLLLPQSGKSQDKSTPAVLSDYDRLMETAVEKGYARIILKLEVKDIEKLTANSTQYSSVIPGARFPSAAIRADLDLENAINEAAFSVLHRLNGKDYRLDHTYSSLPFLALEVNQEVLASLPSFPEVLDIYEDQVTPLVNEVEETPAKSPLENSFSNSSAAAEEDSRRLSSSTKLIGADDAWSMGYTGSGWYVAVLDTGIRRTHQFFTGKTIVEACFSANADCPNAGTSMYGTGAAAHYESTYQAYDHGTHVSGIATGNYGSLAGVAKNSNIIAVQVFSRFSAGDCDGDPCVMSYDSDQVAGLEYIYSIRGSYSIASVNMSLGGGAYNSYCNSEPQRAAIDNLKAAKIATVIATGNDGYCGYIGSPACIASAVAVGASTKLNLEASFNNWHKTLQEFFAPGVYIYSSTGDSNSSYEYWDGTSMATPHVTGAWALLRQASPSSTVDEVFNALNTTGVSIKTACAGGGTRPLIQVDAAINKLLGIVTPTLTVTAPNGSESWTAGSSQTITWTSAGSVGDVKIEYSIDNGSSYTTVAASTTNDGSHFWTVPNTPSTRCKVRVREASDGSPSDASDNAFSITTSTSPAITVTSPNGGESWEAGSVHSILWTSTGSVGDVKIEYSVNNGSSWAAVVSSTANDGSHSWTVPNVSSTQCIVKISEASDGSPADTGNAVFSIVASTPPVIALSRTQLFFGAVVNNPSMVTGGQVIWLNNTGGGSLNWSTNSSASWLSCTPSSGTGGDALTISVNPTGLPVGTYNASLTLSAPNATNSPQTISVYLKIINSAADQPPFGDFSTPLEGSTVNSSIPVTGWVVDDIEVKSVKIYLGDDIYIGDAVFVEGARPDIETSYPGYPKNYLAGWGYMLLTNFLPNGGNGLYTLVAKAVDAAGYQVTLGSKTISCNNNSAVKPFGAIDTPAQGGTASGSNYSNWGWVLTPMPNGIPTNGSTISVYVDGVKLGNATYNIYRSDIAALFPGYVNSNGAGGYFTMDTTAYDNGVHTIGWLATDTGGNSDGLGSRYFTIKNSGYRLPGAGSKTAAAAFPSHRLKTARVSSSPIRIVSGYENRESMEIYPDHDGIISIEIKELEPLEIHLVGNDALISPANPAPGNTQMPVYSGFLEVGDRYRQLPIGSFLDRGKGVFYWQPGPGFVGEYRLVFIDARENSVKKIRVTILP